MLDVLHSNVTQAVLLVTFVLIATTAACLLLRNYRNSEEDDGTASSQLSFFREMRQRGELSETEFRDIKLTLGAKLRGKIEIKSSDRKE